MRALSDAALAARCADCARSNTGLAQAWRVPLRWAPATRATAPATRTSRASVAAPWPTPCTFKASSPSGCQQPSLMPLPSLHWVRVLWVQHVWEVRATTPCRGMHIAREPHTCTHMLGLTSGHGVPAAASATPAGCFADRFAPRAISTLLRADANMTVQMCARLAYESTGEAVLHDGTGCGKA
jgi:hypothetical protein